MAEGNMENIKAVIFDLDNTILDRTSTFKNFTVGFLAAYFGHVDSNQEILERIILLDEDGYKDKLELFTALLEKLPWKVKPDLTELLDYYNREYVKSAVLMDQAREVIQQIRNKNYITGLITNGKTLIQYGKVDQLGIRNDFDFIIVSEEAGCKKPDPRIFDMAAKKLGLKPEECIYIGDHPLNDIEGASKIGMKTIWMKVNQPWKDGLTAKPLHTIEKLSALLDLF
jgi:putative hydrolase of the HAD superfamily